MINQKSIEAVKKSTFSSGFCRPLYDSYCFSKLPGTIFKLLTGESSDALPIDTVGGEEQVYDSVILLFLDGFGWAFFEKYYSKSPFLQRFVDVGVANKITSLFPSTTAAHVTCINTGLNSGQSGVYEWFIYEPKLGRIIAPLPYCFAGDHQPNTLKEEPIFPEDIFPKRTIHEQLKEKNIDSYALQHASICDSPYSRMMLRGSSVFGYNHFTDALLKLVELYSKAKDKKSYFFLYFADIDAVAHRKGIDSHEFEEAIEHCFQHLEEVFWKQLLGSCNRKTALLVVADHGLIPVDPLKTYYINKEIPQIKKNFLLGADEKPLTPAGSCRDYFLHIKNENLQETKKLLEDALKDRAEIHFTKDLIEQGLFGNKGVSQTFLNRVGNLVILPKYGEGVWWFEKHRFQQNFFASHGGLTRGEMETSFLFLPIK